MHRRLAQKLSKFYPLAIAELPFDMPPIRQLAQWDISNNGDATLNWLVNELREVAAEQLASTGLDGVDSSSVALDYQLQKEISPIRLVFIIPRPRSHDLLFLLV